LTPGRGKDKLSRVKDIQPVNRKRIKIHHTAS
jgi:hypothetical protein